MTLTSPLCLSPMLGFGFWRLDQHGSASWVWIDGLGSVDGGFGSVDRWVDRLGWLSVALMVAPVMIFFEWVCSGGVALVLVWFWFWWVFSKAWVSDRWLGYFRRFSRYFQRPRFQISSVGLWSVAWVFSTFFWVDHRHFSRYFWRPGFQIDGMGFWSVAWVVGVVAVVGSN